MEKREELAPLSEAQREIMEIVWDCGEVSVAAVWRVLRQRRPLARNTVLTVITRLVEKGWLSARSEGNAFRYRVTCPALPGYRTCFTRKSSGGTGSG